MGPAEMRHSFLVHLECARCAAVYDASAVQGLCTACGAPLFARYDLAALATELSPAEVGSRPANLWRYHELLPVTTRENVVSFGEGMTPLLSLPRMGEGLGLGHLLVKDEASLPTGTFKARGAAVGVSRAGELGIKAIVMPTNGNAGAAWAVYAARAGMHAHIVMPKDAPEVTMRECVAAGAGLQLVDGSIADAGVTVRALLRDQPWFDASTLKEPYRLEGKKTMGLEIAEQLGWRWPDVIVYPTGGGVGIIGIHKALTELRELGWVRGRLPRLVAVQAAGCAPIVRAYQRGAAAAEEWTSPRTIAFGIAVPAAIGDFLVLRAVRETAGCAIAVDDEMILSTMRRLAAAEGLLVCPEGAAAFAAAGQLRASGWLGPDEEVVILNTGSGLKYPDLLPLSSETSTLTPTDS